MYGGLKSTLLLKGLCCANCASKIEKQVADLSGVSSAFMDFASSKLTIEVENKEKINGIIEEIKFIVKKIEPDVVVLEENTNKESKNKIISFDEINKENLIKIIVGAVVLGVAFAFKYSPYIEFILYFISYILIGGGIIYKAFLNIKSGQIFDENFLMSIATIGAFAIGEFDEAVAVMLFYKIGELFQDMAVNHSRKSITELMNIKPDYANLKEGNRVIKVDPEVVKEGDIIIVKPGEKIPLDGTIIKGKSFLDTSPLTGESVPREVKEGDSVLGGFINKNGLIAIKVERSFKESAVSKILYMVENAASRKAPTENFITKFARYYTPFIVLTALALFLLPPMMIPGAQFKEWFYRSLIFLVVSCPCAMVISIPLSFFGGIGGASKNGILIKGSNYLEALNDAEIVVFDKTGTLTKGTFNVIEINPKGEMTKDTLLKYAAMAESYSNHPIAVSILNAYNGQIEKDKIKNYEEIPGRGIRAEINENIIYAGNSKLMGMINVPCEEVDTWGTAVHLSIDYKYAGYIVISDEIKEDSKKAIKLLKEMGIKKIAMLTGDNEFTGIKTAEEIGISEVYSELLPHQKVEKLEAIYDLKSSKGKLVFVGDGINDAPVLARADVGIAMGALGSDAAIEAADVVVMTDEPSKAAYAIKIARKTKKIVWQNIVFSLGVKVIVLILGALGAATMWEAVFADVGVALIAILNSMRAMSTEKSL